MVFVPWHCRLWCKTSRLATLVPHLPSAWIRAYLCSGLMYSMGILLYSRIPMQDKSAAYLKSFDEQLTSLLMSFMHL